VEMASSFSNTKTKLGARAAADWTAVSLRPVLTSRPSAWKHFAAEVGIGLRKADFECENSLILLGI
jgi:hypothetical protein